MGAHPTERGLGLGLRLLTGYAIDPPTGALRAIRGMPITTPLAFRHVVFHPNGRAVYLSVGSGKNAENGLYAYAIDSRSGALTALPGAPYRFPDDTAPGEAAFNASGTTAFVPSGEIVSSFAVDPTTGALTLQGTAAFQSAGAVTKVVVHPDDKYAYAQLAGGAHNLGVLGIENPAALSSAIVPVVPLIFHLRPHTNHLFDASGQYLYFLSDGCNLIGACPSAVYGDRVDTATGALTPLAGSPYRTGAFGSFPLVMHPTHRYVATASAVDGTITVFAIDGETGVLAHVPGSPFLTVGTRPTQLTFDPSGKFAYVNDSLAFSVSAYSTDFANGQFTFVGSYALGGSPSGLAIAEPE